MAKKSTPKKQATPAAPEPVSDLTPGQQLDQDLEAKAWAERAKNRGKNPLTGTAPDVREANDAQKR